MILAIGVDRSKVNNKTGIIRCHNIRRWTSTELFLCQTSRTSLTVIFLRYELEKRLRSVYVRLAFSYLDIYTKPHTSQSPLWRSENGFGKLLFSINSWLYFLQRRSMSLLWSWKEEPMAMEANHGAKGDFFETCLLSCRLQKSFCILEHIAQRFKRRTARYNQKLLIPPCFHDDDDDKT